MQLVLSNNRVLAHGENFISMGGTVINTETNKVYQNATVAECDGCPSDIGVVGYEYHAGEFVPCAPFGKGKGNIAVYCDDCKTPRDSGMSVDLVCAMSSYLAFAGNVNANMVTAAFGKGNEDEIKGVGKALAMYAWFKGTDKTVYPLDSLQSIDTLNDMNFNAYDEIVNNTYLTSLIKGNSYALSKVFEQYSVKTDMTSSIPANTTRTATVDFSIGDEDLQHPFSISYTIHDDNNVYVSRGYVTINGVEVVSSGGGSETNIVKEWSDCNITTPGTYKMEVGITVTGYQTTIPAAGAYGNATIVKAKQSYDA